MHEDEEMPSYELNEEQTAYIKRLVKQRKIVTISMMCFLILMMIMFIIDIEHTKENMLAIGIFILIETIMFIMLLPVLFQNFNAHTKVLKGIVTSKYHYRRNDRKEYCVSVMLDNGKIIKKIPLSKKFIFDVFEETEVLLIYLTRKTIICIPKNTS